MEMMRYVDDDIEIEEELIVEFVAKLMMLEKNSSIECPGLLVKCVVFHYSSIDHHHQS